MYLKLFSQVSKYFHSCLSCRSYIALEQWWISANLGSGIWEGAVQYSVLYGMNRTAGDWVNLLDGSVSGKSCAVMGELSSLPHDGCPANAFVLSLVLWESDQWFLMIVSGSSSKQLHVLPVCPKAMEHKTDTIFQTYFPFCLSVTHTVHVTGEPSFTLSGRFSLLPTLIILLSRHLFLSFFLTIILIFPS